MNTIASKGSTKVRALLLAVPIAWLLLSLGTVIKEVLSGPSSYNNYLIYKGAFLHVLSQKNLYLAYPAEYFDIYHYGPLFSIVIAPFTYLPDWLGCILWAIANSALLLYAIYRLGFEKRTLQIIAAIVLVENLTATHNVQFNPMLTAWLLLAFHFVKKERLLLATLFIMAAILTKVYGVVGLAFFFFTPNKSRFFIYSLIWFLVMFCLPMLISSPHYVWQTYFDWYQSLAEKNEENFAASMQNISIMGIVSRVFSLKELSNGWFLIPAFVATILPLAKVSNWNKTRFQWLYFSQLLIGLVVFSSSSESPTFVIAVTGVAIWYVVQPISSGKWKNLLLALVIIFTVFSATDLFPKYIRNHIIDPYALKALPCFFVWVVASLQLNFPTLVKFDYENS